MGARGGVKREIVRTLQTSDYREAQKRRDGAMSAIRSEIDRALVVAKLHSLTDWTAYCEARAVQHREAIRGHGHEVVEEWVAGDDAFGEILAFEIIREAV